MTRPNNPVILIIEDEPDMRDNYRDLLSEQFTLVFAESGHTAVTLFQQSLQQFQAIILDINLPDMTGHEVIKQFESITFIDLPPIIVVTAYSDTQNVIKSMTDTQAYFHISKPFSAKNIRNTISKAIKSPEFVRRNFELARDVQLDQWLSERNSKMLEELRLIKSKIGGFVTLKDVDPYVFHNKEIAKKNLPVAQIFADFEDDSGIAAAPIPTPEILLVENEADLLESLSELLTGIGYKVLSTKDSFSAVNIIRENPSLDIILLDIGLPGLDGDEIIQELKANLGWSDLIGSATIEYPDIVVYTGHADHETITKVIKSGASKYLVKPVPNAKLISELHEVLLRRHIFRELPQMLARTMSQRISYRHRLMEFESTLTQIKSEDVPQTMLKMYFPDIADEQYSKPILKTDVQQSVKATIDRLRDFYHTDLSRFGAQT